MVLKLLGQAAAFQNTDAKSIDSETNRNDEENHSDSDDAAELIEDPAIDDTHKQGEESSEAETFQEHFDLSKATAQTGYVFQPTLRQV